MKYIALFAFFAVAQTFIAFSDSQPDAAQPAPQAAEAPVSILGEARELFMEGSYGGAIEAYQPLEKEPATRIEAALGPARCRLRTGAYAEAIEALLALDAKDSAEWNHLLALLMVRVGRFDDALRHGQAALGRDANHAGARTHLGQTLEERGTFWFIDFAGGPYDLGGGVARVVDTGQRSCLAPR